MPKCTANRLSFGRIGRRAIEGDFSGGVISSDAGLLLLRQVDRRTGLSRKVAEVLHDPRDQNHIKHPLHHLVAQRIYGICCGYEDLNDHDYLRSDALMQTAVGTDSVLGSSPTLCRMEQRATRQDVVKLHKILIDQFVAAQESAPEELVLDVDSSDIPLYGNQEFKAFHGYYDHHCYLPVYVYCGTAILACVLRPCRIDGAKKSWVILKLIIEYLRQHWPQVKMTVRADSGFCRRRMMNWCEQNNVSYIIGLARNSRLHVCVATWEEQMKKAFDADSEKRKQRHIDEFSYAAKSWKCERRVITRLEYGTQGTNPRFIVTNLKGDAAALYDGLYCQRGEAENRIKETQLDLFGARTSCQTFISNSFRIVLSALAYTLMHRLKTLALQGTELARASSTTIRVRLLKIGVVVIRNTRRIRLLLASEHPLQHVFEKAALALSG